MASLGEVPSAEELTVWFETLLSVQRSAVGSTEFYQETARAIVDLVGLDRGLVLLREDAGWRIAAGWAKDQTVGLNFSRSVLSRVVEQGRTFYGTPQSADARSSLENVEAVVGSPIFGSSGEVVGVLYGSRDWGPAMSRVGIQPLEAQVVQLLASSVSVGLIRHGNAAAAATGGTVGGGRAGHRLYCPRSARAAGQRPAIVRDAA